MQKIWHKYEEEIVWKNISNIQNKKNKIRGKFAKSEKQNRKW